MQQISSCIVRTDVSRSMLSSFLQHNNTLRNYLICKTNSRVMMHLMNHTHLDTREFSLNSNLPYLHHHNNANDDDALTTQCLSSNPLKSLPNDCSTIPISIYFHWPFCQSICSYCDFNRYKRDLTSIQNLDPHNSNNNIGYQMMKTYLLILEDFKRQMKNLNPQNNYELVSIFFGGGTPSTMNPLMMEELISKSMEIFSSNRDGVEISMEANPTSIESAKLLNFHKAGINRLSIGVQSFDSDCLKTLGREHSVDEAMYAIENAKNIFGNDSLSIDLMFGLPQHKTNRTIWEKTLKKALSLDLAHISLYQLTIEKNTKYYKLFNEEKDLPNEDEYSYMYDYTIDTCHSAGLEMYEVSNFAKPGKECKHNIMYWRSIYDFVGIGPGAHGRLTNYETRQRYSTIQVLKPEDWIEKASLDFSTRNSNPALLLGNIKQENLSEMQQIEELFMMGLRMAKEGVKESSLKYINSSMTFEKLFSSNLINRLIEHDYLSLVEEAEERRMVATRKGINVLDILLGTLFSENPNN
ncbi:hypothetical protein FDP41_000649 [Naegleria fowleri]|uniref:Radical S-adenosyl methionine domain-containing protein 1, mitochondrial n=1 Tax=Naegleria fowleri TaxID=5763 RepID=A0A6A5CGW1_NAEFO|nr:uncharacterized protein FDP41_000649 [Naegleria fowleri]KAF0984750.1 hypothetical protein FDP41_000649 [Naegleria fowleri]CAG4709831.1 unnamed protein product [Naegleria fowleri]